MSTDVGTWTAALLTLAIFSSLWRDNPLYRFAEHLFVGVSSGYFLVLMWKTVVRPNLVDRLADDALPPFERWSLLVPAALGLCLMARAVPALAPLSRMTSAFIVGFVVGTNVPQQFRTQVIDQIVSTIRDRPLVSVENFVFVAGVVSVLIYFVFTVPKGVAARVWSSRTGALGRCFLMVAFGATFGNTVMARVSILIGRVQFLLEDWLGIGA